VPVHLGAKVRRGAETAALRDELKPRVIRLQQAPRELNALRRQRGESGAAGTGIVRLVSLSAGES
jgi:hypothetical protein